MRTYKIYPLLFMLMITPFIIANDGDVILAPSNSQCSIGITLLNGSYANLSQFNNDIEFWNSCSNTTSCGYSVSGSCPSGQVVQNTTASGVDCVTISVSSSNPFDQSLNTTDDVKFNSVNSTTDMNVNLRIYTTDLNVSNTVEVKGNVTALQFFGMSQTTSKIAYATRNPSAGLGGTLAGDVYLYGGLGTPISRYFVSTDYVIDYTMHLYKGNIYLYNGSYSLGFADSTYFDAVTLNYDQPMLNFTSRNSSRNDTVNFINFSTVNFNTNITANYVTANGSMLYSVNETDPLSARYQFNSNNFNGSGNFTTLGSINTKNLTLTNGSTVWTNYVNASGYLIWEKI